ncbi:hypothetical protein [Halopiger goleimassiliensis]|uniref:hypothetical protein n=1 Tax=Halopiger goleimassiliensis TaxID=1293048 RepID=UPI000677FEED|nr:hypothetical protein [Halopiger goleimassiliensis]
MTVLETPPQTDRIDSEPSLELVGRVDDLRAALDVLGTVVDECLLRWRPDGIHVTAVDPALVAMVDLELPADAFEYYSAGDRAIGVDLKRLDEVLSLADRERAVRFTGYPDQGSLRIESGDLEYAIGLLDPDAIRTPPSPEEFDLDGVERATVGTTGRRIGAAVRAAETVADFLEIGVVPGTDPTFYVAAAGDTDEMVLSVAEDELRSISTAECDQSTDAIRSLFSVQYLREFERALPADADVRVRVATEAPLEIRFDVAAGEGAVTYLLSPRIRQQ